jgi:uncharacterized protein
MNLKVSIRIYEELNSYLPPDKQKRDSILTITADISVKQLIEKLRIPISQIDLILVNGKSVGAEYQVNDGDRLSIYPVFETFNISSVSNLHESPLRRLQFICDVHLGRLTKYMRMLGLDVLYKNDFSQDQQVQLCIKEDRIILTRNKRILKNRLITRGYLVKSGDPRLQVEEIITYFDLKGYLTPLSRCLRCNLTVQPVEKESIQPHVPGAVFKMYDKFMRCDNCDRIYWMGSHYSSMMDWINRI